MVENSKSQKVPERKWDLRCRIFGSRFVDEVEKADNGIRLKSIFMSQSYHDEGLTEVTTEAPAYSVSRNDSQ